VFCPSHEHGSSPEKYDHGGFPEHATRAGFFGFFPLLSMIIHLGAPAFPNNNRSIA
jgi:hypothetical protein